MNKKLFSSISLLLCLCGCNKKEELVIVRDTKQISIAVASDLHLLSNNLIPSTNSIYKKEVLTNDGRAQELDYELVEELIETVNENNIPYLVLTGDLTFCGEADSHLELIKLLRKSTNTKILVIPGNHDMNYMNATSFADDKITSTQCLYYEHFKEYYSDFGYGDAISVDEASHSYFYKFDDNNYGLLLDTTLCEYNFEEGGTFVGGFVEESSFTWMEEQLKFAKENNINVISFSHHNFLTHNEMFVRQYVLSNSEKVLDLYKKYNVKINLSGHLHIQNIVKTEDFIDIASGSLIDYGNRYGLIDIYNNCYEYNALQLKCNDIDNIKISYDCFYNKYYHKNINTAESKYPNNYQEITDFKSKINTYYFDGDYITVHQLMKENRSLVRKINKNKTDTYIQTVLKVGNDNQHYAIIEK